MTRNLTKLRLRRATGAAMVVSLAALSGTSTAQERVTSQPSLNFYGATGLIEMPSGEAQPDGMLSVTSSHFGPISRNTLSFQITPRLSGSFRYSAVRDWNASACPPACTGVNSFETYYDRSFDLRYKLLNESRFVPAVTIGLQDIAGTGLYSGEYIAATKNLTPTLKVTAGVGWGRLGSQGGLGSPFGTRPAIVIGSGGSFNFGQYFRGQAAAFGGVEWNFTDNWTFKGEYSSDNYAEEVGRRDTFDIKSRFNFGVEYQPSQTWRVGAYYLYGSQFGLAAHLLLDPRRRPYGDVVSARAPVAVDRRPDRARDPEAYSTDWLVQPGVAEILRQSTAKRLAADGILVEQLGFEGDRLQVRIRNTKMEAGAQAIGRTARVLSAVAPDSVNVFEIVPVVDGVPASRVVIRRADLENADFSVDAALRLRQGVAITDAGPAFANTAQDPELYPKLSYSLLPYISTSYFDPDQPVRADVGLRAAAAYDISPGLTVSGSVKQRLSGNIASSSRLSDSVLPHVRTDSVLYAREGGTALETLTLNWQGRVAPNVYSRVTVGYLEQMFGGVSTEVLWKRPDSPLALGVEVNYVKQREYAQGLGFRDYTVFTGHASAYYNFSGGYNAQLDVGRYLAGDIGATLTLEREFSNGWRVGAFATKTNVSSTEFGEGSFDKGITLSIPLDWAIARPTRQRIGTTIRPIQRDGGARLKVGGRLYETIRDYQGNALDAEFGRFWK